MPLTEAQKRKIAEEETYRETAREVVRKKNKGIGCLGKILLFIVLPVMVISVLSSVSSPRDSKSPATPIPNLTLLEKVRNRQNPIGKEFIVQGQTIKTGEDLDSVLGKIGKPISVKQETVPNYGLIAEYTYSDYKLLIIRNTSVLVSSKCEDCYIIYDIYPENK